VNFKVLFLFLILSFSLSAQVATVTGVVKDIKTKRPIANAEISLAKDGVTTVFTDSVGKFEITITEIKKETIYCQKMGFEMQKKAVTLKDGETRTINFELGTFARQIKETVIHSKRKEKAPKTDNTTDIEVNQQQTNPSGNVENSLKYQGLGVGGNNEIGSQFSVRGGSFDENLIYVNDFEVYRPTLIRNAQQEGLSFANSQLISNMKFSSGGFASEYGDKLSSVLDIQYKKPKKWAGSLEAGLLGAAGHIEGSAFKEKLNILTGVRYRNNAYLLGSQETKGQYTPQFLDLQSNIHFQPSTKFDFESLTCFATNQFRIVPDNRETNFGLANFALTYRVNYSGQEVDKYLNLFQGFSTTYKPQPNLRFKLSSSFYHIDEKQYFDITGQYAIGEIETDVNSANFKDFKNVLGSGIFQNWGRESYQASMQHYQLSSNLLLGKNNIKFGAKWKNENYTMNLSSWDRLDSSGYNLPSTGTSIQVLNPIRANYNLPSQRYEGYLQDHFIFNIDSVRSIKIVGGVRANYWSVNKELFISPRLQIFYTPKKNWTIYAAGGSYNQAPFIRELIDEKGVLNPQLKSQKSLHYIVGSDLIFKFLDRPFKFTAEAYYKHIWDVNTYQYNNVLIRYAAKNNVIAYARGVDFRIQGEFVKNAESWINIGILDSKEIDATAVFTKYRDSLGYEYYNPSLAQSRIKDTFQETRGYIQRPNNQFLMINIFFQDYIPQNPNFKVNLSLVLASGLPFGVPNAEQYRNAFNLLAYKRMDIGFSFRLYDNIKREKPKAMVKNAWLTVDVFNAVDFYNQVSMNWIQDYTGNQFAVPNYLTGRRFNARLQVNF
jgi:CarboxypepD_reg-like domain/TonB-dependent Receptor Plug Domain